MINLRDLYHVGVVVPDLDAAMADLQRSVGYTFTPVRTLEMMITRAGDDEPSPVSVRTAKTKQGPPWLEFLEGPVGSVWSAQSGNSGLHHLAYWVDDLENERRQLEDSGVAFEVGPVDPEGRPLGFSYHQTSQGFRIEIVDSRLRGSVERHMAEDG
jgi:hypothetical protein